MAILERIRELGLELPATAAPLGAYVPAVRTGNLVFTSGQLPIQAGTLIATGKVPAQVSLETAQACARQAALNALAAAASVTGGGAGGSHAGASAASASGVGATSGIEKIARIIRLNVFVNSSPGFTDQAKVANGASELLVKVFGDAGRHTRCAIGASDLPLNAPLELDLVVEVA
ncbi:MAG: RidA family protein [Phycisphaerae bacterium]